MNEKIKLLSDQELYRKCREYGLNARMWMRKFAGLLPEVYRRHLYKKKGFHSIHEFAARLAGMNEATVDKILRLEQRLKDKPKLKEIFESGKVGWSKLEAVSYISKPETDADWAKKVTQLSKPVLETYIQEYRKQNVSNFRLESLPGDDSGNNSEIPEGVKPWETMTFSVSPELSQRLRLLKQRIEKERKAAMNWNEVLLEMADRTEEKAMENKKSKKIIQICPACEEKQANEKEKIREVTRNIPMAIIGIIQKRSGGICEFPECNRPGEIYHHTRRYALKKNHDPNFIRYLCKAHEGILQSGLTKNEEHEPHEWKIRDQSEWFDLKNAVDQRVAQFRQEPIAAAGKI